MERSPRRTQIATIVIILALASLLSTRCTNRTADISISGLKLGVTLDEVKQKFGEPDFRIGDHRVEYWSFKSPVPKDLQLELSGQRVYQIHGGSPEVNGRAVSEWTPEEVMSALGPPSKVASGKSLCPQHKKRCDSDCEYSSHANLVGRNVSQATLSYPQYNLIVNWSEKNGTEFVLFEKPH